MGWDGKKYRLYKTEMFQTWLKRKGYTWPNTFPEQKNMLNEFQREGLENRGKQQ